MAVTENNSAPYAPASAILDIIDRFRNRGLSTPLNGDVLARAGVSSSLIPRTLQSLTTLELIDESQMPTETLENLRRVSEPELKSQLAAWITNVYADVLSFVQPNDDETNIRDAFRSYNPVGQQTRMVSLFLGLCRAADLRGDEQPARKPRPHARGARQSPTTTKKAARASAPAPRMPSTVPPAIGGLIESLPKNGTWTKAERDKFLTTFEAVLDFSYEVVSRTEKEADDD